MIHSIFTDPYTPSHPECGASAGDLKKGQQVYPNFVPSTSVQIWGLVVLRTYQTTIRQKSIWILLFVLVSHSALQQCSLKHFCIHLLQYRTTLLLLHKPAPQEQHLLSMPWTALKNNKMMEFTRAYNGQYKSRRMEVDILLFVSQQHCSLKVLEVPRGQNQNEQLTQWPLLHTEVYSYK